MEVPSKIKFNDKNLQEAFLKLKEEKSEDKLLYKQLCSAFNEIEKNSFSGIQIPKKLISKEYKKQHIIHNLWKYDLPNSWKLLYSIQSDTIIVISIIIEWVDHKNYEKKLKY